MAYVSQDMKKALAPAIKNVLKQYGMKGTIGVNNHSSLVVNIKEGVLDLIGIANAKNQEIAERRNMPYYECNGYFQANPYHSDQSGEASAFFEDLVAAMKGAFTNNGPKWYDNSDAMIDYFDTAYYLDINVGKWNKPYVCTA